MNNVRPVARSRAAIVTPIHRFPLTPEEEISMRHLRHFLGDFPRYIIGPAPPPAEYSDFAFRAFPRRYFRSMHAYNLLMVSWRFFEAFADYDYILIYEPDCLVFSSDLESWCAKGWDYAGAPWFDDYLDDTTRGFWKVGNSGLSLRRVSAALDVLSNKPLEDPQARLEKTPKFAQSPQLRKAYIAVRTNLLPAGFRNSSEWLLRKRLKDKPFRNDTFWASDARVIQPMFKIPAPIEAVEFSFEMAPRYCFEQTGHKLPFGCHAWAKYDREFWEPFLLK